MKPKGDWTTYDEVQYVRRLARGLEARQYLTNYLFALNYRVEWAGIDKRAVRLEVERLLS